MSLSVTELGSVQEMLTDRQTYRAMPKYIRFFFQNGCIIIILDFTRFGLLDTLMSLIIETHDNQLFSIKDKL